MIIAVDTGATKTLVALMTKDGHISSSDKFLTPKDEKEYLRRLITTIDTLAPKDRIDAIVVALPGRVTSEGLLPSARNLGWKNINIRAELGQVYTQPILVENDANLAGLAEAKALDKPVAVCLYVTISTGIGTGIITRGEIDPDFSQSEGGQMLLYHKGKLRRWEKFASGKAIYRTYNRFARDITSKRVWKRIAKNISKGFLALLPTLRPDIVIIGGSIGVYFDRYQDYLKAELGKHLHYVPPIVEAKHPEQAVIYGCYHYALSHLARR